jgi:hypothetical protein
MIKKGILLLIVLMIFFSISISSAYTRDIKTVEGLIDNVTDDSIKVRGNYYNFSGVPLENASGRKMQKDELKVGRKVEIFFERNHINTILIYPEYMVE